VRVPAGRAPGARRSQASRAGLGPGPRDDPARDPVVTVGPGPVSPVRWVPALALGLGLGLLALGPGLRRGFLLSYDMIFVPRQPFTATMSGLAGGPPRAVPSDAVVAAAARVLPADVVQKAVLLAIFMLACSGAAALLEREHWLARLAAGAYYAWNPFVAERLIIGQWALLLGYAGLPWALRSVLAHRVVSWRGAGRLGLALLPACIGGFAAMSISALVTLPAAALAGPRAPAGAGGTSRPAGPALRILTVLAVLLGLSLPWLVPSLLHPVYDAPSGVAAFATRADTPFGPVGSLLMLGGIWNAQVVPAAYGGAWSALWLALVLVAVAGYLACAGPLGRRAPAGRPGHQPAPAARRGWPGLGTAAAAGLVVASIGASEPGRELLRAAGRLWPGFAVLRDGQQFVAPLALAEAAGFGLAVAWAMQPRAPGARHPARGPDRADGLRRAAGPGRAGRPDRAGLALGLLVLLAPVVLLPGLAWGAAGRLRPAWYPEGWLAAARVIDLSRAQGSVLLLPWAAYRQPAWNGGRTLLDPWPRLLRRPVIWDDGPRVGDVQLAPDDPRARRLDGAVRSAAPLTMVLQAAGVRFVIVDAAGPARARLPGCTVLLSRPGLVVYQVPSSAGNGRAGARRATPTGE
jgi:hypothetical protein